MKFRNLATAFLCFGLVVLSCKKDDEDPEPEPVPVRDRQEVYNENIAEIETYLETHFYNYEEFQQNDMYSIVDAMPYTVTPNDTFEIVFDTIAGANSDKISLMDMLGGDLKLKEVTDSEGIEYKLYYLVVREGLGGDIHGIDRVFAKYKGYLIDNTLFDSAVSSVPFDLTSVGNARGVVDGFREGIIEFKARQAYTENTDGTVVSHNHGIGSVFVPSGLGYFSQTQATVPSYSNLIFNFNSEKRTLLDHDNDGVFSYLENLNGNKDYFDDDTDGDGLANFVDVDDDGDGTLTKDEIERTAYTEDENMQAFTSSTAAQAYYDAYAAPDELLYKIEDNNDGTFTLNTVIITDSNNDGTPDYLDSNVN
ncbi:FKBP-type peptidyl-prolyl cis-trans isomerase [Xanthomarina sp. F2636L]|uniref:FKBP-type peptidyl-prolyl cis-trans isomerase n=1 Tax=Xanthomarina sp. F2636L TaxID=2996018 RepID=UPI00225E169A|nr:hypothetical protein [Xanthomarina sp. F2636L]MCX7550638.1 hypothetical protein [Xanthomarina sp. F2636L]